MKIKSAIGDLLDKKNEAFLEWHKDHSGRREEMAEEIQTTPGSSLALSRQVMVLQNLVPPPYSLLMVPRSSKINRVSETDVEP